MRHTYDPCMPCAVQVLKAGDAVVAAARRPEQSPGLTALKDKHGDALQLVKLDVNDLASVKVSRVAPRLSGSAVLRNACSTMLTLMHTMQCHTADMQGGFAKEFTHQ